ncbi:MAG: hypothetical protein LWW85_02690 [Marinilabiliales bacterium]|nr:hypothetical protein [Marinilabiliales bacterium]
MASIRQLKKEIGYISSQVIEDCLDLVRHFNGKELEAMAVIDELVALHNATLEKSNHPDGKDNPQMVRSYYKQIKKDYIEGVNEAYKKLELMVK